MKQVRSFKGYYEAKFWREAQFQPTDFIIVPDQRGIGFVAYERPRFVNARPVALSLDGGTLGIFSN